jgi:hypothetical protein
MYQAAQVNDQAFSTTFQFIPNGFTLSLILENSNNNPTFNGASFSGGAGCEGDEYQGFAQAEPPNNVWAIVFSSTDNLTTTASSFAYSSVQMYQSGQSPCLPNDGAATYFGTNKISTSPVPMNSPATSANTSTGHTYSATVVYTGTTVALTLYDVTAGGTCTPITSGTCFSHTWTGVQIPSIVNGTTAWVGLGGSVPSITPSSSEYIGAWSYGTLSAAATPTLSPSAGTYSGTQTVTISDSSSGAIICYNTTGAPATNGLAGCANGTLYTGAISVTSGQTIYTVAGGAGFADSAIGNTAYQIGSTAAQPTFYPASGTYNGNQTVFLNAAQGTVICYNTTGSPATNGTTGCTAGTLYTGPITVSSNETLYAASGGPGLTNSLVGASAYTINPFAGAAPANSPTYSPLPGTYSGTQNVTIASTTPSSYICYTLAASAPTLLPQTNNVGGCTVGTLYSGPVSVPSSQSLYAMASTKQLGPPSSLTVGAYVITSGPQATSPSCTPGSGSSSSPITVTCSNPNSGTTIMCYTENGTTPATNGTGTACSSGTALSGASGNITISSTTATLNVVAGTSTLSDSTVSSYGAYIIGTVLPTPAFSPAAGTYGTSQSVTISDATAGTTIYYTTNGTAPTTSSAVYTGPITVSSTETLEAIAVETGSSNSAVASATYTIASLLPAPIFTPGAGTYMASQTVTIGDATAGATIYYTTNGTTPTTSSTVYSGPITVSASETLKAIAVETGYTDSPVSTAAYTIATQLPEPTFTPGAGTYTTAQTVTISDATPGATIYYTANGTRPTTSSAVYSGPITVSTSETLEAIAVETGYTTSYPAVATYTIAPLLPGPTFTPGAGSYTTPQAVTISDATTGTTIYYTTNGTKPTTSSSVYSGLITVSASETLEAIAVEAGYTNSPVSTAAYTIAPALPPPTFTPGAGTYATAQTVTISDATAGTTIYYTTNGTTPTTSSTIYLGPITVSASETLEAIAVETGYTNSPVAAAAYTIGTVLSAPTFSPAAGTYATSQTVTISEVTAGATIYYTTNGTTPTTSSTVYSGPITVGASETLEAIAVETRYTNSAISTAAYTITPLLPAPTFTPGAGTYTATQTVTISDAAVGTAIYYTTNGSTPTTSSTKYVGPITVSSTETLEAIAVETGSSNSAVASATYTIASLLPAPIFTPGAGTYMASQTVTIGDATAGATIYYTTNGTTPTTSSTVYSGPITVSASETLKAIAVETGYTDSPVSTAAYTIATQLPEPTFTPGAGTYTTAQTVTISDATPGATIYYTANGTRPTTSSAVYSGPITVSTSETLEAIAVETGYTTSYPAVATYTIAPLLPGPTFTPGAGSYTTPQAVTISDATTGTTIYYTTNGTKPTTSSSVYSGLITVSASETLEAIAVEAGYTNSPVSTAAYTIAPALPPPTFTPGAGTYATAQTVTISDATAGTTIYYTTNGTTPTTSSTIYLGPITVSASETLEAIAVSSGYSNSVIASATYTINLTAATPTFSVPPGTYPSAQTITISDATPGATIYYTTNGTTPTTSSAIYSGPISVNSTETLEAIAVLGDPVVSPVAKATYIIEPPNNTNYDFTISTLDNSAKANLGGSAAYVFTVTPQSASFLAPVNFSVSGLPAGATYIFNPSTIVQGAAGTTVSLTIALPQSASATQLIGDISGRLISGLGPLTLGFLLLPFAGRLRRAGRRFSRAMSVLLLLAATMSAVVGFDGCGSVTGFLAQSYTVNVTGTSGPVSQSAQFSLSVVGQ